MFDFRRITLFCLEKRLSTHKMPIFSKTLWGAMATFAHPWLRLCFQHRSVLFGSRAPLRVHYCKWDDVYFTILLWQNNGWQSGPKSRMLYCELYKIMLNKVTLVQSCKSGRAFRVKPGSGLRFSKCIEPISGLHTQAFYTIQSNDFFFLEVHLFCSPRRLLWVKWLWFCFS